MSIKIFSAEAEKGFPSPVYFLHSGNQYILGETIPAVKKIIPENLLDFNFNAFDFDSPDTDVTPENIIAVLKTISLCGGRRYAIVKNIQKLTEKVFRKFIPYFDNPLTDAALIMLYNGSVKKSIKEHLKGIKTISLDMKESELPVWIKEKVKQKEMVISDQAVEYLLGTVGDDIGFLSSEIEKLSLFSSKEITIENIKAIVEGSREYSVFDLTDALKEKNSKKVLEIYHTLSDSIEPYSLLGAINWQYSKMFSHRKDTASINQYSKALELLNEADIRIKTSGGAYPMEHLFAKLLKL
jgi:DNA polymerase-3 subunit delta